MNKQELADYLDTTVCMVETNFPMLKAKALKRGFLIIKEGRGASATYTIEETEPKEVGIRYFSSQKKEYWEKDEPGERWVEVYQNKNYEVSNYGRVRDKKDFSLRKPSFISRGYASVSMDGKKYALHRVVLLSFDPIDNAEDYTVDHIDGNRSNNKLENLRWATNSDNIAFMMIHRKELNKELTRLLQKHSYDELLQLLQNID